MGGFLDFVFGRGALKKASGSPPAASQPSQPAGIDIAADAQKMADRARGNDGGIGARGVKQATQGNDAAIKARSAKLPAQKTQPNDAGGKDDDDD